MIISRHYYKPLEKLRNFIPQNGVLSTNEIVKLAENTIVNLRNTSASHNRDQQLLELLYDTHSNIDAKRLNSNHIHLSGNFFQSVILETTMTNTDSKYTAESIESRIQSHLPSGSICYAIKYIDWNCYILVLSYNSDSLEDCLSKLERSIHILNEGECITYVYTGNIYTSWKLLHQSFHEAKTTYLTRKPDSGAINHFISKASESPQPVIYTYIDTDLSSLCDAIEQNNTSMVVFMSKQIENTLRTGINDPFMTYSLYYEAINRVLRATDGKIPGWYNDACSDISSNLAFTTIEELSNLFSSICSYAILSTSNNDINNKVLTMENAVSYIDTHFCNPDFSVKALVIEYGMEMSNFSHQFKTFTGKTVTSYINNKRIELAKEMLSDKSATINQVALSSGYLHTSSFIRMFKQEVGITPGEYQDNIQQNLLK